MTPSLSCGALLLRICATPLSSASGVSDIYDNGVQPLKENWPDHVGQLAVGVLESIATKAQTTSVLARSGVEPVDALANAVLIAQSELENGVHLAEANGLKVDPVTGKISLPRTLGVDGNLMAMMLAMNQAQQLIDDAIEAATQANDLCVKALQEADAAEANPELTVDGAQEVQEHAIKGALEEIRDTLPDGLSPVQVAAWWNGLTPKKQFDLERACPTELTHLDGIPDDVKKHIDRPELGYSSAGVVDYAKSNWDNDNIDWARGDHCTTFVSSALDQGGHMPQNNAGPFELPRYDSDGWSDMSKEFFDTLPNGFSHTRTWSSAQANHDFFLSHGGSVVGSDMDSRQVRPGDIVYWTGMQPTEETAAGEVHHAAIVTSVLPDGEVLYTQHSGDQVNVPLNGRLPEFENKWGPQKVEIVRPQVTW